MIKRLLMAVPNRFYLMYFTIFLGFLSYSFTYQQVKHKEIIHKKLIVGEWNYTDGLVGNVIIVFNKNGTGYRFTDSNKIVQKFKYQITRNLFLKFYIGSYKPEVYYIDSLTSQKLRIREYPFIKIKESISVYESEFKKGSPVVGQAFHKLVPK